MNHPVHRIFSLYYLYINRTSGRYKAICKIETIVENDLVLDFGKTLFNVRKKRFNPFSTVVHIISLLLNLSRNYETHFIQLYMLIKRISCLKKLEIVFSKRSL